MPTFILQSTVTVTYEHKVEAESLDEAITIVEEGEDDGIETDSSSPRITSWKKEVTESP